MRAAVPVNLIAGKWYVTRNGNTVHVKRRPSRGEEAGWPFVDGDGNIYRRDGRRKEVNSDPLDIVRPVYKVGEQYRTRDGSLAVIHDDDGHSTYPLNGEHEYGSDKRMSSESWTEEGQCFINDGTSCYDLMDYDQPKLAGLKASVIILDDVQENSVNKFKIGDRVSYVFHGNTYTGTITGYDSETCNMVTHAGDQIHEGCWDCNGKAPARDSYFVYDHDLTLLPAPPEGWDKVDTSVEAAPTTAPKLLPREDRKLLWDVFAGNIGFRGLKMADLIQLRRELDAACER